MNGCPPAPVAPSLDRPTLAFAWVGSELRVRPSIAQQSHVEFISVRSVVVGYLDDAIF